MKIPLHDLLCEILGSDHCYFSPPASIQMEYPCIVYHREANDDRYADNQKYLSNHRYTVTVIDEDPDSEIVDRLCDLPYCRMDRGPFVTDNLYHYPCTLFYRGPRIKEEMNHG